MSRRLALAAALGAAALAVADAPPALATGTITVAASSPALSVGKLQLVFSAPAAITGFTARILTSPGTDVLDLPMSDFTNTAPDTWTVTTPISMSQLTLGSYSVSVDATDANSDSVTGYSAGTLGYLIQPTVTLSASPATITYSQPEATLAGTVTGLWPDGTTGPLKNTEVNVWNGAETDSSGHFSVQLPAGWPGSFSAYVEGATVAYASSPTVTITANVTPVQITANLNTTKASYGQTVTVHGTLTYKPGSSYVPLAGAEVEIETPGDDPAASVQVTDSAGNFSTTFTVQSGGAVTASFNLGSLTTQVPLLAETQASVPITMALPTSIDQFHASLSVFGSMHVSGCLLIAGTYPYGALYLNTTMTIQYAAAPTGPWHRLGTVPMSPYAGSTCGIATGTASFAGTLRAPLARAYYRAYYGGQPNQGYLPSVSSPILAWKYPTEVKALHLSATRVTRNGRVTFTGQLLQDTRGWHPYAHRTILIVYRKFGTRAWYWIAKGTTGSAGQFKVTIRDPFGATWSVVYEGDATHFDCSGPLVKVAVG